MNDEPCYIGSLLKLKEKIHLHIKIGYDGDILDTYHVIRLVHIW